jgi:putative tryptophan/tyrosine transport system substrate-binding protein
VASAGAGIPELRRAPIGGLARRQLVVGAAALLAVPARAYGQRAGKLYRIGLLGTTSPKSHGAFVDAFREGLRERGYVEGKTVALEYRWAENDYARLPALAAELVRLNVDLILTHGAPGARAAKAATATIPIVIAISGEAVATGVVQSLARPGGNVTGSTFSYSELNAKRLELLKEALPGVKRVGVLLNGANPGNVATVETVTRTARSVGIEVTPAIAKSADEFEGAFGQMTRAQCEAVLIYEDPLFVAEARRLAALCERHRLPSASFRELTDAGGLLGFGINFPAVWRHAASFVDRIFKGANAGELPMEQPEKFDTVVNLRTARALKLTIQPKVLLRAETVIE